MLTKRQEQILKIIVEQYIKTGVPVGSKTILTTDDLNCSSATVRNECVELETQGLLEKTHSSSGRVPATKGYRYYVDKLMTQSDQTDVLILKKRIEEIFNTRDLEVNEIIEQTSNILSEMTKLISIVVGPSVKEDTLKRIELLSLNSDSVLAIIITDNGHVENKIFNIKEASLQDLTLATDIFNQRLIGTRISEMSEKVTLLKPILSKQVKQAEYIIQGFINALINFSKPLSSTHGVQYMLENPEFNDIKKVKTLLNFIESQSPWTYFDKLNQQQNVQVKIGEELGEANNNMAMITTTFKIHDSDQGQIAVVGPKRLEYEKVTEILNWINETIKDKFG
ncbi:heat-inducible transcriptional repressor HrcA [Spiroplasma platyhelix]|uniref:Heat-inducible transcription repressor HrcA n=1 Tax=Spiroplasma platyhelix PALS-1 TaxID=1276218 RepID=A0A846U4I3_9MOLU|nr:heat-inducible transcriptional repressor HrcA [Spiroplasma platyhelix]MBE4703994.1 Heat-inducible transcription repressor HrcA [Spiroplasma platyhelix PALS-1]NKE38367.1 heat-inducible transcription repressor HrcA [Spiroplasma platyhelix PALS-1]UJB29252.1 heat-inducible transcription repressor [Spiroplasma platyhelix PALS-1]